MAGLSPKLIITTFLNLAFFVGIILLIWGFISTLQVLTFTFVFDDYPLGLYEEDCSLRVQSRPLQIPDEKYPEGPVPDPGQLLSQCQENLTRQRRIKQIQDFSKAVGLDLSGLILLALFHPKSRYSRQFSQS